ncbi:c-di-GMP-binding flagellar brake protein YcgR [Chitinivorax tropicus]|uniref:Flagellar brake protein YcgR n=1 Tax=Chitinivorax tropicus TaxID=714531 RepID=A0A840MIY4_9PROT|nr:flagellar brake protein [Chitinivorax tropicus]MBB5017475.1 c-di-GMP-binding flagellar brake protein YcgR [Chitinivorax tropicus]
MTDKASHHFMAEEIHPLGEDNPFLLKSPVEILYILNAMAKKHTAISAYFNDQQAFATTSILTTLPAEGLLVLDLAPSQPDNQHLQQAQRIMCVSTHDRVRVQFDTSAFSLRNLDGRDAFVVPIPDKLLKLQRRNYYRLSIPYSQTLKCQIPQLGQMPVEVEVMDISIGGVGVIGYPIEIDLEPGAIFENCSITLPGFGQIVTALQIRSSFDFILRNGTRTHRSGCRFLNLTPQTEQMIQRYILDQERKRRFRLGSDG